MPYLKFFYKVHERLKSGEKAITQCGSYPPPNSYSMLPHQYQGLNTLYLDGSVKWLPGKATRAGYDSNNNSVPLGGTGPWTWANNN